MHLEIVEDMWLVASSNLEVLDSNLEVLELAVEPEFLALLDGQCLRDSVGFNSLMVLGELEIRFMVAQICRL